MLYAIGDIHGMRDELAELLAKLPLEPSDRLIFIGDYVDRGPDPKGVVDLLIEVAKQRECLFLMGNHEAMFLSLEYPPRMGFWAVPVFPATVYPSKRARRPVPPSSVARASRCNMVRAVFSDTGRACTVGSKE